MIVINKEQVGQQIYELRKKYGMTQSELADKIGITNRAVSKWENGISAPSIDTLYKICNCFRISTDYFILDEKEEQITRVRKMRSIRQIYKVGSGPSSIHTMGTEKICRIFKEINSPADKFKVILYGSLAHTGIAHGIHNIIKKAFHPAEVNVVLDGINGELKYPDAMELFAYENGELLDRRFAYSFGGGEIRIEGHALEENRGFYPLNTCREIVEYCKEKDIRLWQYVEEVEGKEIWEFLSEIWQKMKESISRGLSASGVLPGELGVVRKAGFLHSKSHMDETPENKEHRLVCSYAYAVGEENASGGTIVTAPTCGSSGVLPAVLYYNQKKRDFSDEDILKALATAAVFGNLIKTNASISGAECGCQAEIGSACAMAAAAICELYDMSLEQIEYAAEIGMEHHLGLTCDPVRGLVQIPCIERNAVAAMRAINATKLANILVDTKKISFDMVVATMYETGKDMPKKYRGTSIGGLAKFYDKEYFK
ncbi:MAG: L-serine ammonia-lyase, iron-sulfur-dependent, subunit alpha [Clostridia bacterium]|nr:L-serine ammonia-lyase, iron-sulfur-dependent, subunit alpha [Clostridia bacterium]